MNRVIFESKLELITFTLDGHLLHTHKTTFAQRHSLEKHGRTSTAQKRPLRVAMSNGDKRKNNQRATAAR
jgi:hypothetical protein